jgi:hypothetical protein
MMAIDFMDVRKNLYDWAIANLPSGVPALWLYPNAPRPTVDYISLYIASVVQIGWDYTQDPLDNTGVAQMVGDREFTLQVQGYGGDPITLLQNLQTSLQKQSVLDSLRAVGIVFFNWQPIADITYLIDSRYEQRASFDVMFRIANVYTDTLGVISTVVLEEIFKDPSGNIVYDESFTIPPT